MIRLLRSSDYNTWLTLAQEVEPLFGPMVDSIAFQDAIKVCIQQGNAFGCENEAGQITGIVAVDRTNNEIVWLAVASYYRGHHYGAQLIQKAIEDLERQGAIYVQTFAKNVSSGIPARTIYERHGFVDFKEAGKNPANIETVIMIRK